MTSLAKPHYAEKIRQLLSHYEEGERIFIAAEDWTHVPRIKPGSEGATVVADGRERPIPRHWMDLVETVFGILAHDKYGLDTYPNKIKLIDAKEMLSAYASIGMPVNYAHWSFGQELISSEKAYNAGQMGLAYEIVINSDPSIAYCMKQNTKTMQMLVIAHASFGHNSFFKTNHLFRQFTSAKHIVSDLEHLQAFVAECEQKHGVRAVEAVLDAAHALQNHGVNRYDKPERETEAQKLERRRRIEDAQLQNYDPILDRTAAYGRGPSKAFEQTADVSYVDLEREENLLHLLATLTPDMPEWQRQLLEMISERSQYFYPQRQTQLMNEGWATFWHHTLMYDMYDMGLVSSGMMLEFLQSHTNVVAQPPYDHKYFSGINVYALGFAMYKDIRRICEEPTEEDREHFPKIAGNPDWVSVVKSAAQNYKDESFVSQFLSPKLCRDFKLFSLEDNHRDTEHYGIAAIQDEDGFRTIRRDLAAQYRLGDREPRIEAVAYHHRFDRTLVLQHVQHSERPLHEADARIVLQHLHTLWGHPVVLQTVSPTGEVLKTLGCPRISSRIQQGKAPALTVPKFV
jgi:stage V sporulation protein R